MDDLISRQAVIDLFNSVFSDVFIPFARARMFIDGIYHAVPPVTPQQKVGRWIATENEDMEIIGYFCSNCDLPMETEEKTVYCPYCGATMEGVEE